MICPRCDSRISGGASECPGCGMPTAFMGSEDGLVAGGGEVVEPEVLDSLEDAGLPGSAPQAQQLGCTLGPGCGCLGLPLAVLGGVVVSSAMALLWVLSLGRVPFSLARLAKQARRGPFRG